MAKKTEPATGAGATPQLPTLRQGSTGLLVARLQNVLTNAAPHELPSKTFQPGSITE